MRKVSVYTDGCYLPGYSVGSYACLLLSDGQAYELVKSRKASDNLEMELTAVAKALSAIPGACNVSLFTDSQSVISMLNKFPIWQKNTFPRFVMKYMHLLDDIFCAMSRHIVKINWVKGHSGNTRNNRCDRLAYKSANAYIQRHAVKEALPSPVPEVVMREELPVWLL
jgi:ribonuclease HI